MKKMEDTGLFFFLDVMSKKVDGVQHESKGGVVQSLWPNRVLCVQLIQIKGGAVFRPT